MPLATKIIQTETNQVWVNGDNIVLFADPFNDNLYDFIASAPGIVVNVVGGTKTTTSVHITCSGPTSEGYFIATGDPAPTTFFNPDVANSGWHKVSNIVTLIDNTNRVFIGTASSDVPSLRLLSQGGLAAISATTNANYLSLETSGSYVQIVSGKSGAALFLPLVFNVNGAEVARFGTNGCFGINTAAPDRPLYVTKASVGETIYTRVPGGSTFSINNQTTYTSIGTVNTTSLRFIANGQQAMIIDGSSLFLGVGTLTPSTTLAVSGDISGNGSLRIGAFGTPTTYKAEIVNNVDGACLKLSSTSAACGMILSSLATDLVIQVVDGGGANIGTYSAQDIAFVCNSSNFLSVKNATKNVQIGTPTVETGFKLWVNGTVKFVSTLDVGTDITAFGSVFTTYLGVGANPIDASSIAEFKSTIKGVLLPRMTTTQKNAISSPAEGLIIYDTTLHKACVRVAAAWETITSA